MSLTTGKSKITMAFTIEDEDQSKAPVTQVNVWPNLGYEQVIFVEAHFLDALKAMGSDALLMLAKQVEDPKKNK